MNLKNPFATMTSPIRSTLIPITYTPIYRYALWLVCGMLFAIAFIFPWFWWTCFPAVFLLLHNIVTASSVREVIVGGLLVGILKSAGGIIWFWNTYPLDWLITNGQAPQSLLMALIGFHWLYVACILGIGMVFCTACFYALITQNVLWIYIFPFLFMASEVLGSILVSIAGLGPGSSLNASFSFGYIGYPFANLSAFLPLASFGGVYAIAFFGLFLVTLIYVFVQDKTTRNVNGIAFVISLVLLGVFLLSFSHTETDRELVGKRIVAVDTTFPAAMFQNKEGFKTKEVELLSAIESALTFEPDIVVLPEDARFVSAFQTPDHALTFLKQISKEHGVTLIDSTRTKDSHGEIILRSYIFDTEYDHIYMVDKQYLVPLGEYLPYLHSMFLDFIGADDFLSTLERNQNYRPGPLASYEHIPDEIPSVLFCFESSKPFAAKQVTNDRDAALIVHLISHSWFREPKQLWKQLDTMLRIQAIWSRTAILQTGNMTQNRIYYADGSSYEGEEIAEDSYWKLYLYEI